MLDGDRWGASTSVMELEVAEGVARERLLGRVLEEGRSDDTPEAIAEAARALLREDTPRGSSSSTIELAGKPRRDPR